MAQVFERVKYWVGQITELGLLLVALFVILQILFGRDVAFVTGDVVGNLTDLVESLGDAGLVGLVAVAVLVWIYSKRAERIPPPRP